MTDNPKPDLAGLRKLLRSLFIEVAEICDKMACQKVLVEGIRL